MRHRWYGACVRITATMLNHCGETEMLKDAMKLERWVAVISVLLLLAFAELGWR